MQKKLLGTLLVFGMLCSMLFLAVPAGAEDGIIEISSADQLLQLMNQDYSWSGTYKLTADIALTTDDVTQSPIGNSTTAFTGTFDGDGHTISGVNISSSSDNIGLFGKVSGATIQNLTVSGSVQGKKYVGGIVGYAESSASIKNCINAASITGSNNNAGGIAGFAKTGVVISNCTNTGAISGTGTAVGGILGNAYSGTVTVSNCMNSGTVTGSANNVGGMLGHANSSANVTISNCTNVENVTGTSSYVGGVVGNFEAAGNIEYCRNDAAVTASKLVGGIAGSFKGTKMSSCWNEGTATANTTTDNSSAGGIVGYVSGSVSIDSCQNIGTIAAHNIYVGGIIGQCYNATNANVINCYSHATIENDYSTTTYIRSICGIPRECDFDSCYYGGTALAGDENTTDGIEQYAASAFSALNTSGEWIETEDGPRLKHFLIMISAADPVVSIDGTVTVDIYAESDTPFWGVEFKINAPTEFALDIVILKTQEATADAAGFVCAKSDTYTDGLPYIALLNLVPKDSTLEKTLIATLTFTMSGVTENKTISVEIVKAYNAAEREVTAYGFDTDVELKLDDVTYGHGVVLYSEYVLEYTVKQSLLPEATADNCYMVFATTDADGITTKTQVTPYAKDGKWRFSAPGIAAKNMNDKVAGTFYYQDDNENVYHGYTDTYNLVSYYEKMYGAVTKLDTLLDAMLNYGAAAQTYFDYNTTDVEDDGYKGLVSNHKNENSTFSDAAVTSDSETIMGEDSGYTYTAKNAGAMLTQRIQLVWQFQYTGDGVIAAEDLAFCAEYTDINDAKHSIEIAGDKFDVDTETGMLTVYIDQIAAKDLRQMVKGALYRVDADGAKTQVSQSVTGSFACYAAEVLKDSFTTTEIAAEKIPQLQDVCRAALAYSDAAAAYLAKTASAE